MIYTCSMSYPSSTSNHTIHTMMVLPALRVGSKACCLLLLSTTRMYDGLQQLKLVLGQWASLIPYR